MEQSITNEIAAEFAAIRQQLSTQAEEFGRELEALRTDNAFLRSLCLRPTSKRPKLQDPDEPTDFKEFVRFVQRFSGSSFRQPTSTPAALPAQRPSYFQHSRTQSYQRPQQQATEPMDLNVIETDEQAEG